MAWEWITFFVLAMVVLGFLTAWFVGKTIKRRNYLVEEAAAKHAKAMEEAAAKHAHRTERPSSRLGYLRKRSSPRREGSRRVVTSTALTGLQVSRV